MADKLDITGLDLTDAEVKLAELANTLVDEVAALQTPSADPTATAAPADTTAFEARVKALEVRVFKPEELPA